MEGGQSSIDSTGTQTCKNYFTYSPFCVDHYFKLTVFASDLKAPREEI